MPLLIFCLSFHSCSLPGVVSTAVGYSQGHVNPVRYVFMLN
jgi:hypothetical protein